MRRLRLILGFVLALALVGGSAVIVYFDRPVMRLNDANANASPRPSAGGGSGQTSSGGTAPSSGTYSMADVGQHGSASSCWSAINGSVYDLTDWIDRHPGGPDVIVALCGIDGSAAYNGQHGGQRRPQYYLDLLKIGTLR